MKRKLVLLLSISVVLLIFVLTMPWGNPAQCGSSGPNEDREDPWERMTFPGADGDGDTDVIVIFVPPDSYLVVTL